MIDRAEFLECVRDGLVHLNDELYLDTSPLAELLAEPLRSRRPGSVRVLLLDAIDALTPEHGRPVGSPSSRRHRYLWLRYVEGKTPSEIAQELSVSLRQCQRDHLDAIEAVAAVVWAHYRDRRGAGAVRLDHAEGRIARTEAVRTAAALDEELAHAIRVAPHSIAHVSEVLESVVSTMLTLLQDGRIRLETVIPAGLPPIAMERSTLRHILLTLLSDALEWGHRRVRLTAAEWPGRVSLEVEHGEVGAEVRAISHAPTSKDDDARRVVVPLVEMHGGSVETSALPDGSLRVRMLLPPAEVTTVLVVDDNPDTVRLYRRYLERNPFRLVAASNGQEAFALATEVRPDVVMLDLLLEGEDGLDVLSQLRATPATEMVPVIVCSVFRERALARSLGATAFLSKPFTQAELLSVLREHAARPR
jgi:CheY-like chemotaxis protein